jgi:hypothetical protein
VLAFFCGRLAVRLGAVRLGAVRLDTVRLDALPLVDRVRALAELRRAAVRAVVRAGTDLPPV